jgi:DNA-binding MarR family transcriptional regulator
MGRAVNLDRTPQGDLVDIDLHAILGYQMAQASVVTNSVFKRHVGEPEGLSKVEFCMLALIRRNPDVSAKQLALALAVTPPNIAMALEKLEARGWIARSRGTRDARIQHVRLTEQGDEVARRCSAALLEGEREAVKTLSPAEWAMLAELLHKLARAR